MRCFMVKINSTHRITNRRTQLLIANKIHLLNSKTYY